MWSGNWTRAGAMVTAAAAAALLAACVADGRHHAPGFADAPAPASGGAGPSSVPPALVDVDTNQTLTATPGQGVGVFTEYRAGGHWHVWWTCDTTLTGLPCTFEIGVSAASGAIANLAAQAFADGDQISQGGPMNVQATTVTRTQIEGMTFDTSPGAAITLDARVSGQRQIDGQSFLFFAQNGQANGGYSGSVADPLMLEPASP